MDFEVRVLVVEKNRRRGIYQVQRFNSVSYLL